MKNTYITDAQLGANSQRIKNIVLAPLRRIGRLFGLRQCNRCKRLALTEQQRLLGGEITVKAKHSRSRKPIVKTVYICGTCQLQHCGIFARGAAEVQRTWRN